jgi:hypothetical protein
MSKASRHLWVERKLYFIPRSSKDILLLINSVFLGIEEVNGSITFDGKKYKIDNVDIFERFLTSWLLAVQTEESDPVLGDGSDVPIELQIPSEKINKPAKTYSHEKKE